MNVPFKGTPVGFEPVEEPWSEYILDDGRILRVKLVVTKIIKDPDQLLPDGNPIFNVAHTTVLQVFRPDELPAKKSLK